MATRPGPRIDSSTSTPAAAPSRRAVLGGLGGGVGAALAVGLGSRAGAQETAPADHSNVGAWRVVAFEEGSPPFAFNEALLPGGVLIGGSTPAYEAEPGVVVVTSLSVGVWEATGSDTVAYTVDLLLSFVDGSFAGRQTISGTRRVDASGQNVTGEYTYAIFDPTGAEIFAGRGTAEGTRMTVEPMAPTATPEAATPTA